MKTTKWLVTAIIFMASTVLIFGQELDLKGTWVSNDDDHFIFDFEDGNIASLGTIDEMNGGESFEIDGIEYQMKYKQDVSEDGQQNLLVLQILNLTTDVSDDVFTFQYTYDQDGVLNLCPVEDLTDCKGFIKK